VMIASLNKIDYIIIAYITNCKAILASSM
jgi:hypothetical protein